MKRVLLLSGLLVCACPAWAGTLWSDLWRTPDQHGQALLDQGRPAEAAQVFHDPRRKAYAELQAGQAAQAAHDLAAFEDSDSQYNRGNALAHAGRLQEALQAYDAALARDPGNRDARHNRDLVEKALQQQRQEQQQASASGQHNPNQDGKRGEQGQDRKGKQDAGGNSGQQGNATAQGNSKAATPGAPGKSSANPGQASRGNDNRARPNSGETGSAQARQQAGVQGQPAAATTGRDGNAATRTTQDAQVSPGQQSVGQEDAGTQLPISEQQLARDQWLRRIPDDPGGLLRRKFMIEHMLRQQGRQP